MTNSGRSDPRPPGEKSKMARLLEAMALFAFVIVVAAVLWQFGMTDLSLQIAVAAVGFLFVRELLSGR